MVDATGRNDHVAQDTAQADAEPDTDDSLIRRIAGADQAAFVTLYWRHSPGMGRHLWRMLRDRDLVDEAMNDTMFAIWTKAAQFDFRVRLTTWMYTIAHNNGLKALTRRNRHRARHQQVEYDAEHIESLPDLDTPEDTLARRQSIELVGQALNTLSYEHRQTLELVYIEALSYSDIAAVSNCPVNTVKTRVFHARKRLREYLAGAADTGHPNEIDAQIDSERKRVQSG